jgi:hypothetical protein
MLVVSLLTVLGYFLLSQFFEPDIVRILIFVFLFNVYFYYRTKIRTVMRQRQIERSRTFRAAQRSAIGEEEDYHHYLEREENSYAHCPNCQERVLEGLIYCEECGTSLKS